MTINKNIGIKEILTVFALVGAIFAGFQGIGAIAGNVSTKQINEHTIVSEQKQSDQFQELREEQTVIQMDVAVTKERVKTMGEDITDIKEMLRDQQ